MTWMVIRLFLSLAFVGGVLWFAARLNLVPVDVSVRFAPLTVSSEDLLSLAVGDVLLLRHPRDSPLEVTTNDVTFAYAIAGNHRRRLAASIVPTPAAAVKDSA